MSQSPDVIVVGGGVAGCAAAYYLTQAGATVKLFERDSVASHASGFAFGGILTRGDVDQSSPVYGLAHASDAAHSALERSLGAESGVDPGYVHRAAVFLALDAASAAASQAAYRSHLQAGRFDTDLRWLGRGELSHIEARIGPDVLGGLYHGEAMEVEPYRLTLGLWQAAERHGASLVNRAVTGLDITVGSVSGVIAAGEVFPCGAVVLAGGPWSTEAGKWLGVPVPVFPLKGQILRLEAPGPGMAVSFWWGGDYCSTKSDGLLWAGTTEERAGFNEGVTPEARDGIMASLVRAFPYLREARLVKQTACLRPLSVDRMPIIGNVPGLRGAVLATGAGRNGIELGPGMGMVAADLALCREPGYDVSRLSPSRFLVQSD